MERRRFLGVAASGAVGATGMAALSACGNDSGSGDVTLTMVAADYGDPSGNNSSQTYWDSLASAFTRKNPGITVEVAVHSWNEVDKKVADMVADDNPPDIAQIGAYADYASQGKLYKVSELLPIPTQADFLARLAEAGEVGRVPYGLPFVSSTRLLFYNKKLFRDAGLDPEAPPESWGQLKAAAVALKKAGVKIPYGLPLGPEEAPAETLMWMLGGGGSYVDSGGNYTIDSEDNIRTFTWIRDNLVTPGFTGTDPARTDRQKLFDAFAGGDVGMLNGHPTLMQQAARRDIRYGTGKIPGRNGPSEANLGVADWMMAFREGGHREQAGKFLDFVYREKNHYAFASRYDLMPVTTSATTRMRKDKKHRQLWRFLDQLGSAEFYPVGKVSWAGTSAEIKKAIGHAVSRGGDPKGVLTALQRKAEAEEKATASPSE